MKLAIFGMFMILGAAVLACKGSEDSPTPTGTNVPQPTATRVSTAGADVNARDNSGGSLLHEVRFRGHSDIEQILLSADATE